ncbi:MAG: sulfatase-like hydrolase/transferase, partial [Verrucomicrobia bacterium]|nr:sulfatase-like hydrolase/transferase [Verrucomicrobiota bacterium]
MKFGKNKIRCLRWLLALGIGLHAANLGAAKPNVVFIFVDDLGWGDVGCYGNDFIDTPNIDQLAKDGMRFTDFYAAGAVCSPTRCAVQSGQNQARIGITAHI